MAGWSLTRVPPRTGGLRGHAHVHVVLPQHPGRKVHVPSHLLAVPLLPVQFCLLESRADLRDDARTLVHSPSGDVVGCDSPQSTHSPAHGAGSPARQARRCSGCTPVSYTHLTLPTNREG